MRKNIIFFFAGLCLLNITNIGAWATKSFLKIKNETGGEISCYLSTTGDRGLYKIKIKNGKTKTISTEASFHAPDIDFFMVICKRRLNNGEYKILGEIWDWHDNPLNMKIGKTIKKKVTRKGNNLKWRKD